MTPPNFKVYTQCYDGIDGSFYHKEEVDKFFEGMKECELRYFIKYRLKYNLGLGPPTIEEFSRIIESKDWTPYMGIDALKSLLKSIHERLCFAEFIIDNVSRL